MISNLRNLALRRDLVLELARSDLETRIAGRRLGWLWWLLDPLLMMLIYWIVVIGVLGRGKSEYAPYPIFLLCSLVTWKHFSGSASAAASALKQKEGLIRSIPFPTMVLPISSVLSKFVLFASGFAVFAAADAVWPNASFSGHHAAALQVPILMLLQILLVTGISLFLCCVGAMFRDLPDLLVHVLRVFYYLSPGLYGVDMVRDQLVRKLGEPLARWAFELYMLNPFAVLIDGYRRAVLYGTLLEPQRWLSLISITAVTLVLGYRFYQRFDRRVIKLL